MTSDCIPVIAVIVLAAGSSRRFGAENKLLVEIDARPLVTRVIEAIEAAGITRVIVVTGHEQELIEAATAKPGRRLIHNDRHGEGMGASVAVGVAALDDEVDGVLIAQGDMPAIDAKLVANLRQHFIESGCDRVVFPRLADGRQGNPVIWPKRLFGRLSALTGDKGGKRLIEAEGERAVSVAVTGDRASADIDTPEELAAYLAARSSQPS